MAGRTFPISGQIEPKSFPFLVSDLHRNGATGSLKVEGPTYQKALYFRGGRVLFGSSNDPRDQLGAILIEDGRITPEQLEDVNSKVGPGNPLAKVLSETGFVSQRELSDAARAKVERILSDVIAYTSGTFEFEDGVLPKGAVDLKLSTEKLMLTAVRRITDRTFVLRHLDGLDVVLRPAVDLAVLRTEIESDTGGLLTQLDGLSTLKDAAGRTRLDDFEAAKVACALLFLGAVERVGPGGAAGPVLDLAETAREAFGDEWDAEKAAPAPPPPPRRRVGDDTIIAWGKIDPQAFAVEAEARAAAKAAPPAAVDEGPALAIASEPGPEVDLLAAASAEPPPLILEADPAPAVVAAPEPPPAPPRRPAIVPPPPRPAPVRAATSPASTLADAPTAPVLRAAPEMPAPGSRRPSKEDMAALDALLDPRAPEGPLAPLERAPESQYTPPARSVRARRSEQASSVQRVALIGGFLALAGLGFGAVWYLRSSPADAGGAVVEPSPPPVTAAAGPVTTIPAPPPTLASPLATPAAVRTPVAIPTAAPTTAPAATRPAASGVAGARERLRQGQLDQAASGFAAHVRSAPASAASIQLLVACAPETVQKAVDAVGAGELLILPVNFKGRDCFRMCWGLYDSPASAAAAARTLPEYFLKGGASPRVMTRAELVP